MSCSFSHCPDEAVGVIAVRIKVDSHGRKEPTLACRFHGDGYPLEPIGRHFYRCHWCNVLALKEYWGPGRITCPSCKRTAMSAAEHHERRPEVITVHTPDFCDSCQCEHEREQHLL